jgi:transposase-like protein
MSETELLPKPKREPEPVRRLEVFTGAGRRRRWTAEQKARIVAESYESGETVCAVARRHGLTPQQLFGWRRHTRLAEDADNKGGIAFAARPSCFHDHGRGTHRLQRRALADHRRSRS